MYVCMLLLKIIMDWAIGNRLKLRKNKRVTNNEEQTKIGSQKQCPFEKVVSKRMIV